MTEKKGASKSARDAWLKRIEREKKAHEVFHKQAEAAEKSYYDRNKLKAGGLTKNLQLVPLFWSSTNVLHAALFSRMPRPDVRKRNVDVMDGAARQISLMTERGLTFIQDTTAYDNDAHQSVNDFLVAGLGQAKIEMDVVEVDVPVLNPITGQPIVIDGEPFTETKIVSRTLSQRFVYWRNFGWEPTTSWRTCNWVRFEHWMSRAELEKEFDITLPQRTNGGGNDKSRLRADQYESQYCVHEIWDKVRREVVLVCEDYDDILETREDPLGLRDFFPCPRPMFANVEGEEVIPKPDFTFLEDMLKQINRLSRRINSLTDQIKNWGYYDASLGEAVKVAQAGDGTFFPIAGLSERIQLAGGTVFFEIDMKAKVETLRELVQQFAALKAEFWETFGISDITRGQTNPNETASAQRIKDQWANVRLAPKLNIISQFFRDCFRLMAEVLAEKFEPEQIFQMTGVQVTPEMEQVMQDDFLRAYAIDVETDSTIAQDDTLEREQRNETSKTVMDMMSQLVPAISGGQVPAEMVKALMLFTVRTTKYGREFEDAINQLPDSMQQLTKLQQELQSCQQQLQEAQGQLSQVDQAAEQRENIKTQTDAQDTMAGAGLKQAQTAKIAQEVQMGQVFPMAAM